MSADLWAVVCAAIAAWWGDLGTDDEDPTGADVYTELTAVLGWEQRGTASKAATVAVATIANGLRLDEHESLNSAYRAARRMMGEPCPCPYCPGHGVSRTQLGRDRVLTEQRMP